MGWGGKRPGAGRKTVSPRVTISARVTMDTKRAIEEIRAQGISTGQLIDKLVADYTLQKSEE